MPRGWKSIFRLSGRRSKPNSSIWPTKSPTTPPTSMTPSRPACLPRRRLPPRRTGLPPSSRASQASFPAPARAYSFRKYCVRSSTGWFRAWWRVRRPRRSEPAFESVDEVRGQAREARGLYRRRPRHGASAQNISAPHGVFFRAPLVEERQRSAAMIERAFRLLPGGSGAPARRLRRGSSPGLALHRVVCDYIAGMTDVFFLRTWRELIDHSGSARDTMLDTSAERTP